MKKRKAAQGILAAFVLKVFLYCELMKKQVRWIETIFPVNLLFSLFVHLQIKNDLIFDLQWHYLQ